MTRRLTRREMLRLGAGTLLSLGVWPGRLRAGDFPTSGDFTFIAVNDLHYFDEECVPWFAEVAAQMRTSAPGAAFCLVGGDLANDGKPEQLAGIRDCLKKLGIPTPAVIGNHDYLTDTDRKGYETIISAKVNDSFEHKGWQVLGLDTTQGTGWKDTTISAETLRWVDDQLPKLDRRRPTVIFTHFPLGADVSMRPLNADALLDRFRDVNLRAAFSGHFHGFTERFVNSATVTTDRCCARVRGNHDGSKEKGWFVCRASESGEITRQFVEFKPSPAVAKTATV